MIRLRNPAFLATTAPTVASAPSLDPSTFTGLIAWWKADSLALTDGTAVATWNDSSTGGHNLSAVGSAQPTFKTAIYNGLPTIRFNGSSNTLTIGGTLISIAVSAAFTVMAVVVANADGQVLGSSGNNYQFRKRRSGVNNISKYWNSFDQTSDTFSSAANALTQCIWRRPAGSVGTFRENKSSRNTYTDNSSFDLNRVGSTSFGGLWSGDICEVCIYTVEVSDANVDALYDSYFKPRWGLP